MNQIASSNEQGALENGQRPSWIWLSPIFVACIALTACGAGSPIAPTASDLSMPLVPCGRLPNYVGAGLVAGEAGKLYRWERFPLRVSIERASLLIAGDDAGMYEMAIGDGAVAWSLATDAVIGAVEIGVDVPDAHIIVRLSHPDLPEQQGVTYPKNAGRSLLPGTTIVLFPEGISAWVARIDPTASSQLERFIAKIMAHEMGHALGVIGHSPDPQDLMFGGADDWSQAAPAYPWVTERDRNTIGEAYCR